MSSGDLKKSASQQADVEREAAELEIGSTAPLLLAEDLPATKRLITKAEKWFDGALYGGFMGVFNAVYSIWLADEFKEGRGKAFFEKSADWLGHNVASKFSSLPLEENIKRIKNFNVMLALVAGGTMLLLPMKWVENRKPQFTRWIQDNFAKPSDPQKAAEDEAALKQLDETPILGWKPIIIGRAAGMVLPFIIAWKGADAVHGIENAVEKTTTKLLRSEAPYVKRYSRMMAAEAIYTTLCTAGLYIYTHFITPPKREEAATAEPRDASDGQLLDNNNINHVDKKDAPFMHPSKACPPCTFQRQGGSHVEKLANAPEAATSLQPQA